MMSYSNAGQLVVAAECTEQTGTLVAEPNINMAPPSFNMASGMTPQESVAILWDIENCPVPSDVRPEDVAGNIRMALRVHPVIRGAITMFSAYGDFNAFPRRVREGCQRTGVKLVDVPNGRKDAADKAILVDMFLFALDNRPPSFIMLISGDVDFAHALHILGQRGYSVILVIPSGVGVSSALSNAGRFVWDWPSVARGEGFVSSTRAPRNELAGYSMGCHISDNADGQEEEAIVYKGSSRTQSPLPPGTNDAVAGSTASIDHNESTWWVQPRLKVSELAAKFNHLLQYAGPEVFTEEQKIWHFHGWMNSDIKPLMVHHVCSTLEQYVDDACKLEMTLEESTKKCNRQGSMQNQPQASGFKRPASPSNFVKSGRAKTDMTHEGSTQHSGQSKNPIQCYNCGTHGHKSNECLKEKKTCFVCGKVGHLQSFCPQRRQKGAESQQVSVNQNNRPNFRPVEGPSPSTQTTSQNKGKASASDRWEQYVDAAYKLEVTLEESTKKHNCQMSIQNQPQTSGFKRPAPLSNFVKSGKAKTDMTHGGSMQHSGQGKNLIQCYNCGTHGHKSNACLKEKKTCFDCGKVGHLHSFCRQKRPKGADSQQESVNQNNQPKFRPLEATSPSTQTTAQNNEKISAASESQGQHLYEMRDADGPNAPIA